MNTIIYSHSICKIRFIFCIVDMFGLPVPDRPMTGYGAEFYRLAVLLNGFYDLVGVVGEDTIEPCLIPEEMNSGLQRSVFER